MGSISVPLCAVLVLMTRSVYGKNDPFPDVIIGDPNLAENDILGAPITDEEVKAGLTLQVTVPTKDPISTSGYFQGDIIIKTRDQLTEILKGGPHEQRSANSNRQMIWPGGAIPYVISASYSSSERQVIARAMTELSTKTCLTFVPRTYHTDYIHILRGQGCSSAVGRQGGMQTLSLANGCLHVGIVMHELIHAAGFWHEQSRYDRDSYVTIMWGNIVHGLAYNFEKKSSSLTSDLGLPYDYDSIMHYGPYAFSQGSAPTIVPNQRGVSIGQRERLSELDVKGLNLLYQCSGAGLQTTSVPPPSACKDKDAHCSFWADEGYCLIMPAYMNTNCQKSCNVCGVAGCRDEVQHCGSWAAQGQCQTNPLFMQEKCRRSCNSCATPSLCQDDGPHCSSWAKMGYCRTTMMSMCRKSCGVC